MDGGLSFVLESVSLAKSTAELFGVKGGVIKKKIRHLRSWFKHGDIRVAVFGPGGTGKTTLGKYISGARSVGTVADPYVESESEEPYRISGDLYGTFSIAPGQPRRRNFTWPEMYRDLVDGTSSGIINVVSYGYHSLMVQSYKDTARVYPKAAGTIEEFFSEYAELKRQEELEVIKELVPRVTIAEKNIWMLTLVTKQDLWWPKRSTVEDFYKHGDYNDCIQRIYEERGPQNFRHEYVSASLVISNLTTRSGEILMPTASGYDSSIQINHLDQLFSGIMKLCETVKR